VALQSVSPPRPASLLRVVSVGAAAECRFPHQLSGPIHISPLDNSSHTTAANYQSIGRPLLNPLSPSSLLAIPHSVLSIKPSQARHLFALSRSFALSMAS
jgi:hypothetical protein